MSDLRDKIGENIRKARKDSGLSQTELAQKLGLKDHKQISLYEQGIAISLDRVFQIADILKTSAQELLIFEIKPMSQRQDPALREAISLIEALYNSPDKYGFELALFNLKAWVSILSSRAVAEEEIDKQKDEPDK